MGEKDLLLFVCSCVMAGQTQKMPDFFCDVLTGLSVLHLSYRIFTILNEEICEMLRIYK